MIDGERGWQVNTQVGITFAHTTAQNPGNRSVRNLLLTYFTNKELRFWQVQDFDTFSHLVSQQVRDWNARLWVRLQCPLIWPHCPFSLPNLYTPHLLCLPATSRKTKGIALSSKGCIDVFWRGHGSATLALHLCMEITHRCEAFDTSKILSLLEFCSQQAARSAGSWLPHCCLEHLKELRS